MRHRPLRKISCHPFLKIFVNLVSSVRGFISTCINVSSLVTEPHYLGEDIIKNVWGVCVGVVVVGWRWKGMVAVERELQERWGREVSGQRTLKSSSHLRVSSGSLWNTKTVITDQQASFPQTELVTVWYCLNQCAPLSL